MNLSADQGAADQDVIDWTTKGKKRDEYNEAKNVLPSQKEVKIKRPSKSKMEGGITSFDVLMVTDGDEHGRVGIFELSASKESNQIKKSTNSHFA
jgi:ribosomal protein S5